MSAPRSFLHRLTIPVTSFLLTGGGAASFILLDPATPLYEKAAAGAGALIAGAVGTRAGNRVKKNVAEHRAFLADQEEIEQANTGLILPDPIDDSEPFEGPGV